MTQATSTGTRRIPEQARAADPTVSAWVSANAGSGKTSVLADRVLRLLLAGTAPDRLLCLTFTRAAAAEMSNRVFSILAEWAISDDAALSARLQALDGMVPSPEAVDFARQLFARALETPGGLKIQTIHAFCERVLHQFPFEANVPAHFEVMDGGTAEELRREAQAHAVRRALTDGGRLGDAFARLTAHAGESRLEELMAGVIGDAAHLRALLRQHGGLDGVLAAMETRLGLQPAPDRVSAEQQVLMSPDLPLAEVARVAELLEEGAKTDKDLAAKLRDAATAAPPAARRAWTSAFLTQEGRPRARLITKAVAEAHPDLAMRLEREQQRIAKLAELVRAERSYDASEALLVLGHAVLERYEALKRRTGALDYSDLIARVGDLLTRQEAAAWVLYKLDGGIDHILVDEAQDTSPEQWRIIQKLAEEALAGEGTASARRTIFAVGDEKQSIYSFQGADPRMFEAMRRYFGERVRAAGKAWDVVPLNISFRSAPAVLGAVDKVFAASPARDGLTSAEDPVVHTPFRDAAPGFVEIWPVVERGEEAKQEGWQTPLDRADAAHPRARLAVAIADRIAGWTSPTAPAAERAAPGDILVLVRRRNDFVDALIGALRSRGVPVAGADRLVLREHIAVMDLLALADVVLLPEDDLTLATVLRSPLIGLSEEDVMALAMGRDGSLWQALGARRGDAPYAQAHARLSAWRERADFVPPFAFFAQVLGADGGRRRMLERLGPEAADALEAFLSLALEFEHSGPPGLQNFTRWMRDQRAEVRRDMDEGAGEVRIMTVHGAKGLEAPVVILPDTCDTPSLRHAPILNRLDTETAPDVGGAQPSPVAFSPGKKDQAPALVQQARERYLAAQMEEYRRLLYVAMTRARDRLYVAGYRSGKGDLAEGCWYRLIEAALDGDAEEVAAEDGVAVRRYRHGAAAEAAETPTPQPQMWPATQPDWLANAAPQPEPAPATLSPSRLAEADAAREYGRASGEEGALARQEAIARGNLIHHLLQYLPQMPNRPDGEELARMADRLAATFAPRMADEARATATAEAVRLLADPSSAFLFSQTGRAELPLAGRLRDRDGTAVEISGQIDRLIVTDREVVIVDYKSNRQVPARAEEAPAAYLAQLSAYRQLLARIYPEKAIRSVLVWTAGPTVMEVSAALLDSHDPFA